MKLMKFANLLVAGLVLAMAASGCKKKPVDVTPLPGQKAGKVNDPRGGPFADPNAGRGITPDGGATAKSTYDPATGGGIPPNDPNGHAGWNHNIDILKSDTVYFEFDSAVVKDSEKSKVSAVADYLKANPTAAVLVEGNCDERGTEEYNRSLGERRALAVREILVGMGIAATTVDTISNGKDKPADPGHDEAAWKMNRRDDFIVLTPPAKP